MMKLGLLLLVLLSAGLLAADTPAVQPVPTLVPPTLVPVPDAASIDALPSESAVARIAREGVVRVGMLYNEPPFGEFNVRGEESGFDADLARAMAEAWGVEIEFVQVTRQTNIDMLISDQVDMLLAALPRRRELDARVDFSHTYFPGTQALLVRQDDGADVLGLMADRRIGVVLGSRGEQAARDWASRVDYAFTIQTYLTLDQALVALTAGEIDGVVENRVRLERANQTPGAYKFVPEPVAQDPYAIAVRRQDVNFRNLVNKTLHYLVQNGRMDEIHRRYFNGASYPAMSFVTWGNVGDSAPRLDQVGTDIPFPAQYVIPQMRANTAIRVAGLNDLPADAPESARRLDTAHRALINALAMRWQASVVYLPNSRDTAFDLLASGQADLAVGVVPDWNQANRVDFTSTYLLHGTRLLIESNSGVGGWGDLRGKWIGIFDDEPDADAILRSQAEAARAIIDDIFTITREQDVAFALLVENNVDAVLGDSLKLIPHVQANPDQLSLLTDGEGNAIWYTRYYMGLAVPRNDIDFRLLVEYTLQEIVRDGEMAALMTPVMLPQDMPHYEIWPGSREYLGYNLGG